MRFRPAWALAISRAAKEAAILSSVTQQEFTRMTAQLSRSLAIWYPSQEEVYRLGEKKGAGLTTLARVQDEDTVTVAVIRGD
jgi:hypothetical protein